MTTVYFVRHGTTVSNVDGRFQGATDIALNDMGLQQAEALAECFRGKKIDAAYTSPLTRARQTAEGVCRYQTCVPQPVEGLKEVNGGRMENHTNEENNITYPGRMETMRRDPARFEAPDGENGRQVWKRVKQTVEELVAKHPDQAIAIVSHGYALMTYLGTIDCPFEQMKPRLVSNASVTEVQYDAPGQPKMIEYNNTDHLPESARFRSKFWKEDTK